MEKGKFMNFIALSFYLDAITNFWSVSRHLLFLIIKEYNFLLTEKNEIQKTAVSQKSVLIFLIKFCLTLKGYNVSLFTEQLIHSALFFSPWACQKLLMLIRFDILPRLHQTTNLRIESGH